MINTNSLVMLISATLLLSFISSLVYSRTKIPDIIWLIGFGILVGPVLELFEKNLFLELAPLMSTVALAVILVDAGINVDIVTLLETMLKSTILSIISIFGAIISVGYALHYFMPQSFTLLQAMLLGAMIGGTSTVSVFGILRSLENVVKDLSSTEVLLTMESIISDPLCIVLSITIIQMIMLPGVSLSGSLRDIFSIFSLSSLLGFAIGLVWTNMLDRLRRRPFVYMITLAILFPSYITAELLIGEGGGAMTALTLGLTITNYRYIAKRLGLESKVMIDRQRLREFHEEITFLIKSFFFVYIGLVVSLSLHYFLIGLAIVALIMAVRYMVATGIGNLLLFSKEERVLSQVVYASGLPAFVMSQLPMIFDPTRTHFINPDIYPNLCMPIVLGTVLYSAILGPLIAKRRLD
jgi:cell volume regulation protein A